MLQRSSVQVVPVVHVHTHVQVKKYTKVQYVFLLFTFYSVQYMYCIRYVY